MAKLNTKLGMPISPKPCVIFFYRVAKFSNVHHLTIYISSNFGADTTTVFYIGLKGEFTPVRSTSIISAKKVVVKKRQP